MQPLLVAAALLPAATLAASPPMEKLGAYVMQAAETSPVSWNNRTLLLQTVSGNTPGVYPCCTCHTFGCTANATAPGGYSDCSACAACTPEYKKAYGSCAPEIFQVVDLKTLEVLVPKIPGTEGFAFGAAFVDSGKLWVYGTNGINGTNPKSHAASLVSCFSTADPTNATGVWEKSTVLEQPAGYQVYNVDVAAVAGKDPAAPKRKYIMSVRSRAVAPRPVACDLDRFWTDFL
jgi:hypothetical protein